MINFFAKRPSVAKLLFGRSASARTDYCKCIQIKGFSLSRRNNCSSAVQSVTIRCVMIAGVGCSKKLHTNNFLRRLAARSALELLNFYIDAFGRLLLLPSVCQQPPQRVSDFSIKDPSNQAFIKSICIMKLGYLSMWSIPWRHGDVVCK